MRNRHPLNLKVPIAFVAFNSDKQKSLNKNISKFIRLLFCFSCSFGYVQPLYGQYPQEVLNISASTHSRNGTVSSWTVPSGGPYKVRITARGAKGGGGNSGSNPNVFTTGGAGAILSGEFIVSSGQVVETNAGAPGQDFIYTGGGGGGGGASGARIQSGGTPLVIAGGGGAGSGAFGNENGNNALGSSSGSQGGSAPNGSGGGGFSTPGANGERSTGGGAGYNATGGESGGSGGGGFGAGGAGTYGGGGGGGYSGGSGGGVSSNRGGGGGGSYNQGSNQSNLVGNTGGGQVIINVLGVEPLSATTLSPTQPVCATPTQGSVSIDPTYQGSVSDLEYAIVSGNAFASTPTFTTVPSDPFILSSGFGTIADADGETYTLRLRLKANTGAYVDRTYTLTSLGTAATRLYVDASKTAGSNTGLTWTDAFTTLQAALNYPCSANLTEIWVAQGTYTPTTTANRTISFVMKNGLAIYGGFDGTENSLSQRNWETNVTTLSGNIGGGQRSYHVINNDYTSGNQLTSSAVLDGFTVTGGLADGGGNSHSDQGGGMFNYFAAPTVNNCIFTGNSAAFAGGGISNLNSAASISNCTFTNNSASNYEGGGIFNYSFFTNPVLYASVSNCTFSNNSARSGGGISNRGSLFSTNSTSNGRGPSITYCTFTNNSVSFYGGGISADSIDPTINHCVFTGNNGGQYGGGLFSGHASIGASYCSFSGNSATTNGGGIYAYSNNSTAAYVNCSFYGNTAQNGGGIYLATFVSLVNSSFSGNTASSSGGGIWVGVIKMVNCIVWGNNSELFVAGTNAINTVTYSIIKQASGVYPGTGNLNVDPLFVGGGNLHLQNGSPAINAGTATGAPDDDYDGEARPLGGGYDMGYDEVACSPSTAPLSISGISTICNGENTVLTLVGGSAGTGAVAEWTTSSCSGTVIGTGNSITVSPSSSATYFVKYNGACGTTACASINVAVNTPSTAPLSISGISTVCQGNSTTLTLEGGSAGTGAIAEWTAASCSGTVIGTGNSITVSPSNSTTYFVKYKGICNTTACASQLITVNTLSVAPTSISGATAICQGNSTTLAIVGGSAGTGAVAEWFTGSCGGTSAGTGNSIIVAPTANTTYYVRYKGTCNTTGCASVTVNITTPSVGGTVSPAQSQGCGPQTVNLSVSGITGTVTRWERQTNCTGAWASIGNAGLAALTVTTPNASTCYRAVVTNGVCASANSTISTITVDKPAVGGKVTLQSNQNANSVSICANQNVVLIPKNHVGKVAKWQFSVGTSSTWVDVPGSENAPTLTINGSTVPITIFYRVVIITELGLCTGQASVAYSSAFKITKKAGCSSPDGSSVNTDEQTNPHLTIQKVYPNPASNLVSLDIENPTHDGVTQLEIMDVTGRQVLKQNLNLTEGFNTISLDISTLSRGIFIVKITDSKNQRAMVKMVKQ